MKHLLKVGLAAAIALFAANAPASAALVTTSFCEAAGNPRVANGAHPGRCVAGDISTGTSDISLYNAGTLDAGEKFTFKGYGDNLDSDIWLFTATKAFTFTLDSFGFSGVGSTGGFLNAFLTAPDGTVTNLTSQVVGVVFGQYLPGLYTITVLGNVLPTDTYNYDLSIQAVPVPGAALLFGSALLGGAFASRRRRKTA